MVLHILYMVSGTLSDRESFPRPRPVDFARFFQGGSVIDKLFEP